MRFLWCRFIGLSLWLLAVVAIVRYLISSFPSYIADAIIENYGVAAGVAVFLIIAGNIFLSIKE